MRFRDLVSLIIENLSRRKGRVSLTAIGVVIGTAAVVLLVSLASGLQKSATSNLYGINDLSRIEVYPNYGESQGGMVVKMGGGGGGDFGATSTAKLLTPNALQDISLIPGVSQVIPRDYLYGGGMMKVGKLETWANMMGVATDNLENLGYPLSEGTLELRKGTAIVGSWVTQNFYDPNMRPGQEPPAPPDLLNQRIKLVLSKWTSDGQEVKKTVTLEVTGVLQEARNEADGSIFVTMEDLTAWNEWFNGKRINRNKEGYSNIIVRAESPEVVVSVTEGINELGFMAYSPQSTVQGINSFFIVLQLIFGGIGAIALLVAAIGIANTMTMAILERTREIGLMKAVGATNRDVLSIFLGEAAGIGFLGGIGGILLGWGGGKILNILALQYLSGQTQQGIIPTNFSTSTPPWLLLFAIVFATLVGFLSGLYPALRAATLEPVMALKYE
jgi:putative ABC transport system permease protein